LSKKNSNKNRMGKEIKENKGREKRDRQRQE
jgi:hypothetical protein